MGSCQSFDENDQRTREKPRAKPKLNQNTSTQMSNDADLTITVDSKKLRIKILMDIPFEFLCPTIILLFGPPGSDIDKINTFLSAKLKMDSFTPEDLDIQNENWDGLSFKLESKESCKGFILRNFPNNVEESQKFYDMTIEFKKIVIFVEYDCKKLLLEHQYQHIHPSSGREYHVIKNPPKSMKKVSSTIFSDMFDDVTGEVLVQKCDVVAYRAALRRYMHSSPQVRTFFAHSVVSVQGQDQDFEDVKTQLISALHRMIATQSKRVGRPVRPTSY